MSSLRLTYLDVLKAIAVIAVVLYHFGLLRYGYLGVDVFLVVGGFLVTRSLQKRSEGGRGWYPVFLFDRFLRLLPVMLVAGIAAMEEFYHRIGMPVNMRELGIEPTDEQIEELASRCEAAVGGSLGSAKVLYRKDMLEIYRMAR